MFGSVGCNGLSLVLTSLFFKEGFALQAITSGDGKICFRYLLFLISVQCFLILWISSVYYCVTKISLSVCLGFCFLVRVSFLSLNRMSLMWLIISLCLYPLCLSLCTSLYVICLNLFCLSWF